MFKNRNFYNESFQIVNCKQLSFPKAIFDQQLIHQTQPGESDQENGSICGLQSAYYPTVCTSDASNNFKNMSFPEQLSDQQSINPSQLAKSNEENGSTESYYAVVDMFKGLGQDSGSNPKSPNQKSPERKSPDRKSPDQIVAAANRSLMTNVVLCAIFVLLNLIMNRIADSLRAYFTQAPML